MLCKNRHNNTRQAGPSCRILDKLVKCRIWDCNVTRLCRILPFCWFSYNYSTRFTMKQIYSRPVRRNWEFLLLSKTCFLLSQFNLSCMLRELISKAILYLKSPFLFHDCYESNENMSCGPSTITNPSQIRSETDFPWSHFKILVKSLSSRQPFRNSLRLISPSLLVSRRLKMYSTLSAASFCK